MSSLRQRSFLNASVAAGSVLALGLLLLARTAGAATFCINYSASPDVAALRDYDFSILSPEARVEAAELRRLGHRSHAYLSVVEVAKDAPYRAEVLARQIPLLGKNEVWLGDLADVVALEAFSEEALAGRIEHADAIMMYHFLAIGRRTIERLEKCRIIVRCGVGFDNVDRVAARERGITVANVPDYGTEEVAEIGRAHV